jgi:hypothetical protein
MKKQKLEAIAERLWADKDLLDPEDQTFDYVTIYSLPKELMQGLGPNEREAVHNAMDEFKNGYCGDLEDIKRILTLYLESYGSSVS